MNPNGNAHPGRSVDFLSRLHDGELEPGERARFEVHRGHCAECRRAALEFEDALSLFRSARSSPPRADLAARILRKVQSTPRARAPFTARFRLDLGWAGLLATAILALLLVTPISVRSPDVLNSPEPSVEPSDEVLGAARPNAPKALADSRREQDSIASGEIARPPASADSNKPAAKGNVRDAMEAKAQADAPSAPAAEPRAASAQRQDREIARMTAESGRAGGEGEGAAVSPVSSTPLVSIEPIDGFGPAPALVSPARLELAPSDRGRDYVLLVDSQGVVREVTSAPRRTKERRLAGQAAPAVEVSATETGSPRSLSELRFQPGNRARRLLVRLD